MLIAVVGKASLLVYRTSSSTRILLVFHDCLHVKTREQNAEIERNTEELWLDSAHQNERVCSLASNVSCKGERGLTLTTPEQHTCEFWGFVEPQTTPPVQLAPCCPFRYSYCIPTTPNALVAPMVDTAISVLCSPTSPTTKRKNYRRRRSRSLR